MSARLFAVRLLFAVVLVFIGHVPGFAAEELRIETDVFVGDASEPVSRTVTLFDTATVYNFDEKGKQVAVFRAPTDSRDGRFVLLDLKTQQRTEVTTDKISGLMKKLSQWAKEQDDPLLKFSAQPEFEEKFEPGTGQLMLSSSQWNYTVATVPAEDQVTLGRYRQFVDWYAQLNVMLHGTPPVGPRLALNAALEKNGVVPVEIRRSVESQSTALRATHLFSWRLSREDRAQVERVRQHLANFTKVDNKQFLASRNSKNVVRGQSK